MKKLLLTIFSFINFWTVKAQSWSELGTGVNALNANGPFLSIVTDGSNNIYAAGYFTDNNGKQYVAKWNGTMWSELGTGSNALNANQTYIFY